MTTHLPAVPISLTEAFVAAYAEHGGRCLARARGVLRDQQLAEDAVQEAFVEFWTHPRRYDARQSSLGSWLLMLTHRRAVDRARAERRRAADSLDAAQDVVDAAPTPYDEAVSRVEGARARQCLATLPETQRRVLVLAYWGGYSQSEIATLTGMPLGTVKTRTRNGLRALARALG